MQPPEAERRDGHGHGRHRPTPRPTANRGTPASPTGGAGAGWLPIGRFARATGFSVPALRHSAAIGTGYRSYHPGQLAAILGHSRNSTTLDIYAHAVPANRSRAVEAIQRPLRGAG